MHKSYWKILAYIGVSWNRSTPKSSLLMLFSIRNHQVRGTPMAMEIPINTVCIHGEYGSVAIISKDRAMSRTSTYIHLGVSIAMEVPANGKIPLKWMIWGYPYFRKAPFVVFGVPKLYYIDSTQIFTHILCFIYIITNIFFSIAIPCICNSWWKNISPILDTLHHMYLQADGSIFLLKGLSYTSRVLT